MSLKCASLNQTSQKKCHLFCNQKAIQSSFQSTQLVPEHPDDEIICSSWSESMEVGKRLGRQAKEGSLFCFFGQLGSGKTTVIKGIVQGAIGLDPSQVTSPTFLYLNIYTNPKNKKSLCHFDLYRLNGVQDFLNFGFEEYLSAPFITCIEWSERIAALIPPHAIALHLSHLDNERRHLRIKLWEI